MINSTQFEKHTENLENFLEIMTDSNIMNLSSSEINTICRNFLISGDTQDLRQIILQINKINIPFNINLLSRLIATSIALFNEKLITYHKILITFKSILELNYIDNRVVVKIFDETLNWLFQNSEDETWYAYFELLFNSMNYSSQAKFHILNNFPFLINKYTLKSKSFPPNGQEKMTFNLEVKILDYIYNETQKGSPSPKQLHNYLEFVIKFYSVKNSNIKGEQIFWYLTGRILSSYDIGINGSYNNDLSKLDIFNDLSELHHVLHRIIHSQPDDTPSSVIAKILFSFSGVVINNYGFQFMMDILSFWYEIEENVNFRYGFHLTYLKLIQHQNPEMTLNFISHIIFKENDPDLLVKVVFNLYELGINWHLIYPFIILPLLHNNDLSSPIFKEKIIKIYQIYFDDLMKSNDGGLISKTEDLFLVFWMIADRKQKKELIIPLRKWIKTSNRSNTIKGIFIKSLIIRTTEPHWIHILNNVFSSLGQMSVKILDDEHFHPSSIAITDQNNFANQINGNNTNLDSILKNYYCMGCKSKINFNSSVICEVCKFSFCNECKELNSLVYIENDEEKNVICLGSALSGFKHNFKELVIN